MPLVVMLAVGLATALHAQVVGDWQFNEKAPGNNCDTTLGAILDSSGNAHHGTEPNPLPYLAGAPGYGTSSALSFNQIVTNRVLVPDPGGFFNWSSAQSVTMEAVVRTVNIGSSVTGTILAKQVASPGEWYWRITPTGMQRLSANDGTGIKSAVGTRVLNDGQWHHLAAVYDATAQRMQVYVDYVADGPGIATTFTSTIGNTNDLWIGRAPRRVAHSAARKITVRGQRAPFPRRMPLYTAATAAGSTHLPCSRMRSLSRSTASASGMLNFTACLPT